MDVDRSAEVRARLLTGALRRNRWLIAVLGLGCLALGLVAGLVLPNTYTATATVLVNPLEGNPFSPEGRRDDLINLQTESQLVATDPVARAVAGKLGGDAAPEDLRSRVSVVVPPNTQVLEISFTGRDPQSARDGAQAFATSYLDHRRQRTEAVVEGRLEGLREQIAEVEEELERATRQRGLAGAGSSESAYLSERISAHVNQLAVLNEQVSDAASTPIEPGQVITPAVLPQQASGPGPLVYGAGGLLGGLVFGLVLAVAREIRDDRIHDVSSLERVGTPVLSVIPKGRADGGLAVLTAPTGEAGEAYRRLRAAVVARMPKTPAVVLVAGVSRGQSAVLTSANLAIALARTAVPTILVDAHAADPGISRLFRLANSPGLSNVLLEGEDPVPLLVQAGSSLRLMPAGTDPSRGADRYPGPQMREAVEAFRSRTDVVLVCAPSLQEADGQALCAIADAALLVASLDATTAEDLIQATAEVERWGAAVLGTVAERGAGGPPAKRPGVANRGGGERPSPGPPPTGPDHAPHAPQGSPETPNPEANGVGDRSTGSIIRR